MAKFAPDTTVTGETGVHLVARVVDGMNHLWHPPVGPDSGIDGQIELRDADTGEVRNIRLGVQIKSTSGRWDREKPDSFVYRPKPRDLAYWLSSNQPVLLICTRGGEAYWRSVQEWARDPAARKLGYMRFDKHTDRFDESAAERLFDLRAAGTGWVQPPGPPPVPELLLTNLMPIEWRTDRIFSIAVPGGTPAQVLGPAWASELRHEGVLRAGRYWSFQRFNSAFVEAVGGSDQHGRPLASFLDATRVDELNVLKELVVRTVVARHRELRLHAQRRVAYFRRLDEEQKVEYAWSNASPRTVVHVNYSKEEDRHFTGYRHDAAHLAVRDIGGELAVQIAPTYLYTWDGSQVSGHHDKALAGIKRLEKHRSVSASTRMWQHLFTERPTLLQPEPHTHFTLRPLIEVEVPYSIRATDWTELTDEEAAEVQGTIFGLEDPV